MQRRPADSLPRDRVIPWRRHLAVVALSAAALAALFALASSPDAVERVYVEGFGSGGSRLVSWMSSYLPVSLAELIELGLVLWAVLAPLPALRDVLREQRRLRNAVASGLLQVLSLGAVALVLFYGLWGLNYARAPAVERLGWEPVKLDAPEAAEELALLAEELVDLTNDHYLTLHGAPDGEVVTSSPTTDLNAAIDSAYLRVAEELALHPSFAVERGPVKPLLSSPLFSWLGISGFYFPFTGEANYNTMPPAWHLPHTIAHEKAHQRGVASEDEANFFGFLACIRSDDPFVRYSGWLFAQRRLVSAVLQHDPERGMSLLRRRHPGVQRDVNASHAFWTGWDGYGHVVGSTVNDAYLRTNGVEGGIRSYSLSTRLIVAFARERGGSFRDPDA